MACSSLMTLIRVGLTILPLLLAPALRAEASGIAGPDQTMAEGLIVLLGDPTTSGTGRGSDTWRWRQIQPAAPLVKLSHINYTKDVSPPWCKGRVPARKRSRKDLFIAV